MEPQNSDPRGNPTERRYGPQVNPRIYLVAFFLFLAFIVGMGILTQVLPRGAYDRAVANGAEYIVDGSYRVIEGGEPLPSWRWFAAPLELLLTPDGAKVMLITATIMLIGGIYAVLDRSGLVKRFLAFTVRRFGGRKYLMLAVISVAFILIGSIAGIIDNFVLLVPLTVALSYAMGWDSFVGAAMVFVAATRGFAASTLNPYTIGVTQALAGVPLYSGMWLRLIILAVTIAAVLWWLLGYARRVERDPSRSLMYAEDLARRGSYSYEELARIERHSYPLGKMLADFGKGALAFLPMLLLGAMIMSLGYILTEGQVLDTVIYSLSKLIAKSSPTAAALQMLLTTAVVEIFIPGSIIKVYALMPIFIPLGDLVGLSRQIVCLVYILGDSFVNMLYPTDMMLMVVLGMIGSNYFKWLRWILPFMLAMIAFCVLVIALAVRVGYA